VKVRFTSSRKEVRATKVRNVVERNPAWSWLLVGKSSYLNGDVGITCGDSELRQTNHHVHPLVCVTPTFCKNKNFVQIGVYIKL
jgi:hypothetical protein